MPEYALVLAVLHQAVLDLRPIAPAHERAMSVQFFRNHAHHLARLCDLIDLDHETVQAAVRRQYPMYF